MHKFSIIKTPSLQPSPRGRGRPGMNQGAGFYLRLRVENARWNYEKVGMRGADRCQLKATSYIISIIPHTYSCQDL